MPAISFPRAMDRRRAALSNAMGEANFNRALHYPRSGAV